jgi:tetratricopeptide (TPR) repeat protein
MKAANAALIILVLALTTQTQIGNAELPTANILLGYSLPADATLSDIIGNDRFGQPGRKYEIEKVENEAQEQFYSAETQYKLGLSYFKYGSTEIWHKGVGAFKKAIEIKPDYAEAYCKLGEAYDLIHKHALKKEHPIEEIEAFQRAIEIKPDYAEPYVQLAYNYDGRTDGYKRAEELVKKALEIDPEYDDAYQAFAGVYIFQHRDAEALEARKKALLMNLNNPRSYYSLYEFVIYEQIFRQAYDGVIETFKEAIRLKPNNALAYHYLGMSYYHQARYSEAIEAYKELIRLAPKYSAAHYELGAIYVKTGDKKSALTEYRILVKLSKRAPGFPFKEDFYQRRAKQLLKGIETGQMEFSYYPLCAV